jgi:hypothetical protein
MLFVSVYLVTACAAVVLNAAPVFYVSTSPTPGTAGPPIIDPGLTGTLYVHAQSDVRLSGVSLDLIEIGGGIKFTGATVHNPNNRWAFTATPTISDSVVARIDGGAIPGIVGGGIGPGSPEGAEVMFASVDYMATGAPSDNQFLFLRVGGNIIADWVGNSPLVAFGGGPANVPGGVPGGFGPVGYCLAISGGCDTSAVIPVVDDADLGNRPRGEIINHTFQTLTGAPPIAWSDLSVMGPGGATPAHAPTLNVDGAFTWNSADSVLGTWAFRATVSNNLTSDMGTLTVQLVVPEPAAMWLFALAIASLGGLRRRSDPS